MPNSRPTRRRSLYLWLFFGLKGRISRRVYWMAYLFLIALNSVVIGQILGGESGSFFALAETVGPFLVIATLYCNLSIAVKRLHDIGYGGFLAAALFVPFVNLAFTIWVGLLPGMAGPNQFGEAPDSLPA